MLYGAASFSAETLRGKERRCFKLCRAANTSNKRQSPDMLQACTKQNVLRTCVSGDIWHHVCRLQRVFSTTYTEVCDFIRSCFSEHICQFSVYILYMPYVHRRSALIHDRGRRVVIGKWRKMLASIIASSCLYCHFGITFRYDHCQWKKGRS